MADNSAVQPQVTTLNKWDFHDQHVQTNQLESSYINAESTLIASGPPLLPQLSNAGLGTTEAGVLSEAGAQPATTDTVSQAAVEPDVSPRLSTQSDVVFPVGLLENFGLGQNKQVQRIYEIGSARSYFIPGRTLQSLQFGRVFFNGPSLLRSLYAVYKDKSALANFGSNLKEISIEYEVAKNSKPGYGQFFINLQSDLFNQPFGLAVFFKDQRNRWYGAFYCEMAYIQGHQFSISAGSVLIVEGVQAQFDNCVPIDIIGEQGILNGTGENALSVANVETPPAFETGVAPAEEGG